MAAIDKPPLIRSFPRPGYVDALLWLPSLSNFSSRILAGAYDPDSSTSSLQTLFISSSSVTPRASISVPSRIASLKTSSSSLVPSKAVVAAATRSGSAHFYSVDLVNESMSVEFSVSDKGFHSGAISGIDLTENGSDCVTVGEDGKINLVSLSENRDFRKVFDNEGWDSYNSVKWASPVEFVTGSFGFSLQWWDQRKATGPVAFFKLKDEWNQGAASGSVHSIDIHTSRKHTCLAGGTGGTLFAWDIRAPKEPVLLSRPGGDTTKPFIESTIWEVQYDDYRHSSKAINSLSSSSKILPAMTCSEDGILASIEQGEEAVDLLAGACSINTFDINKQNPADVVCSLEWESIVIVHRS
ncbi:hypothetical protein M569_00727 [Genlisea aurea]|uniref:Uncharacterized protein n=1 Tax=Genlisea aurea TaxID=192259 RepID=S8EMU9_9LAMI|nr:hypothetical protein M569_00727 [Genlisea aurea]